MEPEQIKKPKHNILKSNLLRKIATVFIAVTLFAFGWLFGNGKISLHSSGIKSLNSEQSNTLSTDGLQEIYQDLLENYDGTIKPEDLLDGLKKGAVAAVGDTYTEYLSAKETEQFNSDLNGTFDGIGAELGKQDSFIIIIAPIKGTPADKAGLQPKDVITEIDNEPATDITVTEAVNRIRGPKGSTVTLKVIRDGQELEVPIVRDTIDIPSVEYNNENGIGTITISRFSSDTTELVQKAANEFKKAGVDKVILDLRGNPGGLLDQAVGVSGVWLTKGSTVLEEKRGGETVQTFRTVSDPILNGVKTVILINEGSASASEIVSGALKDNGVATLMGVKSYGKGSVQQLISLSGGGSLKVTIARWYTPNGKNIDKEGIEPDTKVERTLYDIKSGNDPQLDAAKTYLIGD